MSSFPRSMLPLLRLDDDVQPRNCRVRKLECSAMLPVPGDESNVQTAPQNVQKCGLSTELSTRPCVSWDSGRSGDALDDGGVGHAAAFAHGLEAVLDPVVLHVVDQRGHQAGTGGAERVAD